MSNSATSAHGTDGMIRREYEPSDWRAASALLLHFGVLSVCVWAIARYGIDVPLVAGTASAVLGYFFARGLELGHALMHGRFFTRRVWYLNRVLGNIVTFPFLLPWSQWRWTHFHHHRDPRIEGFDYPDVRSIRDLPKVVRHHLMVPHWSSALRRTAQAFVAPQRLRAEIDEILLGTVPLPDKILGKIVLEYRLAAAAWIAAGVALATFVPWVWPYAAIALLAATISHVMIEFPEHVLADLDDRAAEQNSFELTDSPLADILCMNNTRHATHHRFPEVPIYHLPHLSRRLRHPHSAASYGAFWKRFARERLGAVSRRGGAGEGGAGEGRRA
ncbi:fatty acid desaturase family protein [Salinarimonas sp. NSM]|uniref:fatty acid desaturase family protein n=1 Tax=Salinarimonas sp. NSM TaxID=3458003 RepID=UPI004035FA16